MGAPDAGAPLAPAAGTDVDRAIAAAELDVVRERALRLDEEHRGAAREARERARLSDDARRENQAAMVQHEAKRDALASAHEAAANGS